ncbi:MAG: hypothetical protein WDO18_23305 [Acidobacteriota bacterium]
MVIQFDEAVRKLHNTRKICKPSGTEEFVRNLLQSTCRWPAEPPRAEPISIEQVRNFRRHSPPPPPREFWMDLDPAC